MIIESTFPDPNASKEEKSKPEYFIQHVTAAMYQFRSFAGNILWNNAQRYEMFYQYAQDKQPIDIYKKQLDCENKSGDGETNVNLNWTPFPVMSNIINIILAKLMKVSYEAICTPIDPEFVDKREDLKYKMIAYAENKDILNNLTSVALGFDKDKVPMDAEMIEEHIQEEYREPIAIQAEDAIAKTLTEQNYELGIRKQLLLESIITGFVCKDVRKSKDGKRTIIKPLMAKQVFCAQSVFETYNKIPYGGYIENLTFDQLKSDAQGSFTDKEYEEIYKNHTSERRITQFDPTYYRGYINERTERFVQVATYYFITNEKKSTEKIKNKYGNTVIRDLTKKKYKDVGKDVTEEYYEVVYEGKWIVNSKFCYNYQMMRDMEVNRLNEREAIIPLQVLASKQINGRINSLVENSIPTIDEICMSWFQFQNSIRRYVPDGFDIDYNQLLEIANTTGKGGQKMSVSDQLKAFGKTGLIVSNKKQGTQQKAITPIANSMMDKLVSWLQIMDTLTNRLRYSLGLNDATDGSSPQASALVGVQKLAFLATENSINYLSHCDQLSFYKLCQSIVFLQKGVNLSAWDIRLDLKPTAEEWDELYARAWEAVAGGALEIQDVFKLKEMTNLKKARRYFARRTDEIKKQKQAEAENNLKMQSEYQAKAAVDVEKEKQNTISMQLQAEMQKVQLQGQIDMEKIKLEYTYKLQEANINKQGREASSQIQANAKVISQIQDSNTKKEINAEDKDTEA